MPDEIAAQPTEARTPTASSWWTDPSGAEPAHRYDADGVLLLPAPPSPSSSGPTTALAVVVGVLVVAILGTAVVVALRGEDGPDLAADVGTPSPSGAPSRAPTDPSTESSSPPIGATPTVPLEVRVGAIFEHADLARDWDFRYGDDVALRARFDRGWDFTTCGPVEVDEALSSIGCVRASEWILRSLRNKLAMTHIVLTFRSAAAARRAVAQGLIEPTSFRVRPAALVQGTRSRGTFTGDVVQGLPYVVLTVETHAKGIKQRRADDFTTYGNADLIREISLRY